MRKKPLNFCRLLGITAITSLSACDSPFELRGAQSDGPVPADVTGGGISYGLTPVVSVSAADLTEGDNGDVVLPVTLTLNVRQSRVIVVQYISDAGDAVPGVDFRSVKGSVTFALGETQKTVELLVIGDTVDEFDERFFLRLSSVNATIESPNLTLTILDDDPAPMISATNEALAEGDVGASDLTFSVLLDAPSEKPIRVQYSTVDGKATSPEDFDSVSGELFFAPGKTVLPLVVPVFGDSIYEADETFSVVFENPVNAGFGTAGVTGTIIDDDDPVSGLAGRPSNLTCIAPDAPTVAASIADTRVFRSLPDFVFPVAMSQPPSDASQWYVAEQGGTIYRFDNVQSPSGRSVFVDLTTVVDSSFGESGLLGFAFHPDYGNNGHVYVSYTATGPDASFPLTSRLSRFTTTDGGLTLDPASELVILSLDQPFDYHNGGHITFGPDGYLFMGLGDGGGDAVTYGNRSQNTLNLFGSVLRIDVDTGSPYGIPASNPFAGNALCIANGDSMEPCPEIYAWGFRNPWRFTFDRQTGELWLGDVGEHTYEEVNIVEPGGNYGWNIQEGPACFEPQSGCDTSNLVQPVAFYDHSVGNSITGGYVYRGSEIPELIGRYVFVDFVNQKVFATLPGVNGNFDYEILIDPSRAFSSLAEDQDGELYGLRYGNGRIHKFIQGGGTSNNTIPDLLSDTGCVDPADPTVAASGVIPFEPIAPFWSDGAVKERYYAIPDAMTVDVSPDGDWLFPVGTVLIKNFRLSGSLIETRLFMRHTNGEWGGYTYEWDDLESQAVRVIGGKTKDIGGQPWIYPSESECQVCHTDIASSSLGLEFAQLNKNILYPSSGQIGHQLVTADEIDVLTDPLPDVPANLPMLVNPADANETLGDRARSYLHSNCSGCHRPGGPTPSNMDLRHDTLLTDTQTCDVVPNFGMLGIPDARIIAPGDASRSVLVSRINRRDVHGMPPLGSSVVDAAGVALLSSWIDQLASCP